MERNKQLKVFITLIIFHLRKEWSLREIDLHENEDDIKCGSTESVHYKYLQKTNVKKGNFVVSLSKN